MTTSDRPDDGALVTAVAIIRDMVRLSEMGFEQSLLEPEENGNYATFERAKAFLASTPTNTAQVAPDVEEARGAGEVEQAVAWIGRQIDKEGGCGMTRPLSDGKRYMVITFDQYAADLSNRLSAVLLSASPAQVASAPDRAGADVELEDDVQAIVERVTRGFRDDVERIMGDVPIDYRTNLATALFEASYQMRLRMWSDETRDYWLNRADAILAALSATPSREGEAEGWSGIASAPTDRSLILATAWVGDRWAKWMVWWDAEFHSEWDDQADELVYRGAWTDGTVASWGDEERSERFPTHWRPYPETPAALATKPEN